MSTRDIQDVKKLAKGMYSDTNPIDQPPNTYRYALNMMLESREGDHSAITNEEGNEACSAVKSGYQVIGTILVSNNDTIIFSTNGTKSEIGILSQSCVYTSLIESTCLNFSRDYPINGIFKIHNGCDRIIYFTDNYNPIRVINLESLIQYVNSTSTTVTQANATDDWNCNLFRMDTEFGIPEIQLDVIIDGGGILNTGSYIFTMRYLDFDFNPTIWTDLSQVIQITEGNNSIYDDVDGGNFDLAGNVLFNSGKSIQLTLDSLDTQYPYYQLGVIHVTDGVKDEGAAYILPESIISSSTETFIYTGNSSQQIVTTLEELVVDSIVLDKVKTIAQIDNRMLLANTKGSEYDWSEFQREASKCVLRWGTRQASKNNYTKNPEFVFSRKSYMRDEIYSFGLVFVFNDGTVSPAFHIPGRAVNVGHDGTNPVTNAQMVTSGNLSTHNRNTVPALTNWDTQLLDVIAGDVGSNTQVGEEDVKHIPITEFVTPSGGRIGSQIERWKVYNTAVIDGGFLGQMSYTECDTEYPDILDCSGNSIWGVDAWGNSLSGEKIRHHKMPDATLSPHHDGAETAPANIFDKPNDLNGNINLLHVRLDNLTIPANYASEIQGFYLVRAQRDSQNKTIVDKGYVANAINPTSIYGGGPVWGQFYAFGMNTIVLSATPPYILKSNKTTFTNEIKDIGYIKNELANGYTDVILGLNGYTINDGVSTVPDRNIFTNRSLQGFIYVDEDSRQELTPPFTDPIENQQVSTSKYFMQWDSPPNNNLITKMGIPKIMLYSSAKVWNKPYSNLFSISYQVTGPMRTLATTDPEIYGGDTFITELTWQDITRVNSGDYNTMERFVYGNFFVESDIHSELRSHGSQSWETHFRYSRLDPRSFVDLDGFPDDASRDYALNYFNYSNMYSQEPNFKQYFPLPVNWDYCSECNNEFPYRIWYSERSFQEERQDNYTEFLANNYQDIMGASGDINKLFVYKDQLYAQTSYATWFISTRPQTMTTNEGNVEIGTGDIFSIPPKRIESVDRGYAGNQHQRTNVVTEFGTFWVDADAGKIFLMSGKGPKDVTLKGMRNWFAENLPFSVLEALPDFNIDSHTSKNGVGLQAFLDPRHNRILLHKRDYKLIGDAASIESYSTYTDPAPNTYGYNTSTREYYSWSGGMQVIEDILLDVDLYEDKSWTISLNLMGENWASYHSYLPMWGFTNRNNFFTTIDGSETMWKHGSRNYGVYYNSTPAPSIVDYIYNSKPYTTKTTSSLQYVSKAEEFINGKFVEVLWDTWDQLWAYNSNQSSGFLAVHSKQDFNTTNPFVEVVVPQHTPIYARDNEGTFSISEFYDMTINKSDTIVTQDWANSAYRNARLSYGILDYPNNNAVDLAKNPFEIEPMRDKWLGARFWYSNSNSYKFTTEFVSSRNNISFK